MFAAGGVPSGNDFHNDLEAGRECAVGNDRIRAVKAQSIAYFD
jgi:hypothetical protein